MLDRRTYRAAVAVFLIFLFSAGGAGWAQTPKSLTELPLFKGAKLVSEEEAPAEDGLRFGVKRIYSVTASPEEVLAYFEKLTAVRERFPEADDENLLKVGETTSPYCQVYFWDESGLIDEDMKFGTTTRRAWIKKALQGRSKDREGAWVQDAAIEWYFRDSESSMTKLTILIQDLSVDEDAHTYELKTEIVLMMVNYEYEI